MIQRLKKFLTWCRSWVKRNNESDFPLIPETIGETEKIVRSVFSPINIDKKKGTLNSNAYRSPSDKDEVSVNRLDFTTPDYCKALSKESENPEGNRNYFGLAILLQKEILELKCETIYTPVIISNKVINIFHSDIKVGYVRTSGEQLPSEISWKINNLAKKARLYKDPNPENENWCGTSSLI